MPGAAHRQEVTKACIRASGLVDARLVGSVISFDDSVGRSAALIAGRYPQAHMARAKGLSLCFSTGAAARPRPHQQTTGAEEKGGLMAVGCD